MRKTNRIIMILVSVLLSLVLITSSVLSGTFAKYVTGEKSASSNTGRAAKWGISVTTGDHLEKQYTEMGDEAFKVHTTGDTDIIAPGTSGSLAWFRVSGNPEVAFDIDFSGNIDIGKGFWSLQDVIDYKRDEMHPAFVGMTEAEKIEKIKEIDAVRIETEIKTDLGIEAYSKLTPEEKEEYKNAGITEEDAKIALGNDAYAELTQKPKALKQKQNERAKTILFEMEQAVLLSQTVLNKKKALFLDENGNEIEYFPIIIYCVEYDMLSDGSKIERSRSCIQRTTVDQNGTTVKHRYFNGNVWRSVPRMLEVLNGESTYYTDKKLDTVLDTSNNPPNEEIDKVFAVEWYWPYDNNSDYPSKGSGTSGTYQTKELDTQLGEAVAKVLRDYPEYSDMFNIKLDMSVSVNQIKIYEPEPEPEVPAININLEDLYDKGFMRSQWWNDIGQSKNDYTSLFDVTVTKEKLTSAPKDKGDDDNWADDIWPDRSYFSTKMYEITSDTRYEYTFEAKNNSAGGYAGVIFAYDITEKLPYLAFGEFDNSVDGKNCIYYRKGHSDAGKYDCVVNNGEIFAEEVMETNDGYGQYKVIYDGFDVKFFYLDTSGEYVQLGDTITLPEGSKVCVGVYSPFIKDIDNKWCTVSLRNCVLTAKNDETIDYLVGENISLVKEFTLKVATFNINGAKDYTKIAAAIKASGADIIALQEVWYRTSDSDWCDQAAKIAELVGYDHHWTFKAMEWNENGYEKPNYGEEPNEKPGYGVSIISKYDLGSREIVGLSPVTGESRILARVGIVVENEVLQFCVTQLSETEEVRKEQFDEVANAIAGFAEWDDVILMGDFNTDNWQEFEPIVDKGFSLVNNPDASIGTYNNRAFDNIVHSEIFTSSGGRVVESTASDHYLLYTTLTYDEARLPMMSK